MFSQPKAIPVSIGNEKEPEKERKNSLGLRCKEAGSPVLCSAVLPSFALRSVQEGTAELSHQAWLRGGISWDDQAPGSGALLCHVLRQVVEQWLSTTCTLSQLKCHFFCIRCRYWNHIILNVAQTAHIQCPLDEPLYFKKEPLDSTHVCT